MTKTVIDAWGVVFRDDYIFLHQRPPMHNLSRTLKAEVNDTSVLLEYAPETTDNNAD